MTPFVQGDEHPALQHVLQETYGLETYRFTAGIRTGNNQDALLLVQLDVERYYLFIMFCQGELEQRMDGGGPLQYLFVLKIRLNGFYLNGKMRLGTDKVDFCQKFIRLQNGWNLRTDGSRELREDTDNLPTFFAFQFTDAVVGFHHFGRLDEDRLTRGRFIVYDTFYLALQTRSNGNHQTSVAHGRSHILVHIAFGLCCTENGMEASGDASCGMCQFPTDAEQFRRGIVAYLSELVENVVDSADELRKYHDVACQITQIRVGGDTTFLFAFFAGSALQEAHDVADGLQGTSQVEQFLFFHVHAFHPDAFQRGAYIKEILVGKIVFFLNDADELCYFFQTSVDFIVRFGEGHVVHPFLPQGAEAFFFQ